VIHAIRAKRRLAVLTLNIDRYQHFINRHGYDAGDELLGVFARRLETLVRQGDTVSRIGGDEFVVLLADIAARADVEQVITKLRDGVSQPFPLEASRCGSRSVLVCLSIRMTA
jgi:diguanylate cyclase (GGDEF)-like protein